MKKIFCLVFLLISTLYAQDTTRSQAFKQNQFFRPTVFKAKYPSYSLLAGYLLVTEANRGDPFAQHELGLRYLLGQGFSPDTVKSIYWIRKAVDQNFPSARYNYGILLFNGIGVPWNPFEAYLNFKIAGGMGLPEAQFAYGLSLTDNLIVNRNLTEAYTFINRSASAGYEPAKEVLKQFKKMNILIPADSIKTQNNNLSQDQIANLIQSEWNLDYYDFDTKEEENIDNQLTETLNKNSSELKKMFGINEGLISSSLTDTSGIGILKFAADNGSPEALLIFGRLYEKGYMLQKDLVLSASYYLRAYRLGSFKAGEYLFQLFQQESFNKLIKDRIVNKDADAMYVWAGLTALGMNNQISNQQAFDFLTNAVKNNHVPSMIELGLLYSSGAIVAKNKSKAIDFWELAKNSDSKEAEIRIAFIELTETPKSDSKLNNVRILEKAVNEGSSFAQSLLGYCYEKGIGVIENKAQAVKLYRHSAQRGNQSAQNSLKRMYDEIRPTDEEFIIYSEN
ncbi:MAG: sel1 repeat family protein [Ignavibacteria bacterium]|nr:sel1 repeat family protein [Ignavibacteria bacterium]